MPTSTLARAGHRYLTIDDALGPPAARYFGDGYRKVSQHLHSLTLEPGSAGVGRIAGTATVSYPGDWSLKSASSELRPHLSSIDAVVLAAEVAECCLALTLGLHSEQRRRMWIRSVTVRAGAVPLLDLSGFDVSAAVTRSEPAPLTLCGHVSTVECRVGPIKVAYEIEHEPGQPGQPKSRHAVENLLEEPEGRYYGGGYKKTAREICDIDADSQSGQVEARIRITEQTAARPREGIGAAYHPCLTPVDVIVTTAQLAQVMIYSSDTLTRDKTNTLWMRHFSFRLSTPYQPITNPGIASLTATRSRVIPMAGQTWRTLEMTGTLLGISGEFSVTHALPPEYPAPLSGWSTT